MKKLVAELNAKLNKLKKQTGKAEEMVFVKDNKKQISMYSISETFTKEQRAQVLALSNYLRNNENLTQEELNKVLKAKFFKFAFLRKLNKEVENLVSELKEHGPIYVMWQYHQNKIMKNLAKETNKKLMP